MKTAMKTATSKIIHLCALVEGMLRLSDRELNGVMADDSGAPMSARQVRDQLKLARFKGYRVIPVGEACEGFSYQTGCPGHTAQEQHGEVPS